MNLKTLALAAALSLAATAVAGHGWTYGPGHHHHAHDHSDDDRLKVEFIALENEKCPEHRAADRQDREPIPPWCKKRKTFAELLAETRGIPYMPFSADQLRKLQKAGFVFFFWSYQPQGPRSLFANFRDDSDGGIAKPCSTPFDVAKCVVDPNRRVFDVKTPGRAASILRGLKTRPTQEEIGNMPTLEEIDNFRSGTHDGLERPWLDLPETRMISPPSARLLRDLLAADAEDAPPGVACSLIVGSKECPRKPTALDIRDIFKSFLRGSDT